MSQHIKPRLCRFCTDSRTHRPGKVSIKSYPERGRVWQYGICESCGMRYTPAEVKEMRRYE